MIWSGWSVQDQGRLAEGGHGAVMRDTYGAGRIGFGREIHKSGLASKFDVRVTGFPSSHECHATLDVIRVSQTSSIPSTNTLTLLGLNAHPQCICTIGRLHTEPQYRPPPFGVLAKMLTGPVRGKGSPGPRISRAPVLARRTLKSIQDYVLDGLLLTAISVGWQRCGTAGLQCRGISLVYRT